MGASGGGADAQGFVDRVEQPGALVAHVRRVQAVATEDFGQRPQFLGAAGQRRRVDQAAGEAERAGAHAFLQRVAHDPHRRGVGGLVGHAQRGDAQGAVPD